MDTILATGLLPLGMDISVTLTKRVTVSKGKRFYYPAVISANGRVKPDYVTINGTEHRFPEGNYYLDWSVKGKRVRQSVGKVASKALISKERKETELKATAQGIHLVAEETNDGKTSTQVASALYLEETGLSKKPKTLSAYSLSLQYFLESCSEPYIEDIGRTDMLAYSVYLRDSKRLAPRTVRSHFANVMIFFKSIEHSAKVKRGDRPKSIEEEVEVYEKEDLDKLFAVCTKEEEAWCQFYLMSGMREQEVIHMTWDCVNFSQGFLAMRYKPQYNWFPKGYKEREIPLADKLAEILLAVRPENPGKQLLFPTAKGNREFHLLRRLKAIAKRGNLDEDNFYLHKFRATFATWSLWSGVDLRTVQQWLGHVDLKSTMRYLKPSRGVEVRAKMNATFG
jgi:integrase/recombinase XerD